MSSNELKKEEWKPVNGYEGLYAVSNLGRVKSLWYDREKILKPQNNGKGYLFVNLYKDGKVKHFLVHRLVATVFIPNPEGLPEINHLDEDKTNNVVSNIEWCNRLYNNNYGNHNERSAASRRNDPSQSMAVEASKYPDFRTIELRFASTREAGRNGYCNRAVSACCKDCYSTHRRNFYKGLFWRFTK